VPDAVVFNTRLTGTDIFVAATEDLSGNILDVELINDRFGDTDTALFDSDTLVMPVAIAALPACPSGTHGSSTASSRSRSSRRTRWTMSA
jgi:hypothetical protein